MKIAQAQQLVGKFNQAHQLAAPAELRLLDLVAEIGETAKELLLATGYGRKPQVKRPETAAEIGDVFYSLLALANSLGIDLEAALRQTLAKYRRRLKKGSAGSESERN